MKSVFLIFFLSVSCINSYCQCVNERDLNGTWQSIDDKGNKMIVLDFIDNFQVKGVVINKEMKQLSEKTYYYHLKNLNSETIFYMFLPFDRKKSHKTYLLFKKVDKTKIKVQIKDNDNQNEWVPETASNTFVMVKK